MIDIINNVIGGDKRLLSTPPPACLIDEELMKAIDILVVNELEASFISGIDYTDNNLEEIAETLLKAGTSNVVITLGSQGAYYKSCILSSPIK